MAGLTLKNLTKQFEGRTAVKAVDSLDLDIADGELLVLLGPSGCGKTTTLRMVAGLETGTEGMIASGSQVLFDAEQNIDLAPEKRDIGMVFQSFALWPHMTVRKNIAYSLKVKGNKTGLRENWVGAAAELVNCSALLDRYPSQLSGGQQQRVALARALVSRPDLLLFDEPLSNLDAKLRDQLRSELHRLHGELEFSGLYVTHDQAEALTLGDRVAIMREGRLEQLGAPAEVFDRPATAYVASFIGIDNAIALSGDASLASRMSGPVEGTVGDTRGADVDVRVHDEDLHIGPAADIPAEHVALAGVTVTDVSFAGRTIEVAAVAANGARLRAKMPIIDAQPLEVGASVTASFDPDNALVYKGGSLASTGSPRTIRISQILGARS